MARTLAVTYLGGLSLSIPVASAFKLKTPNSADAFFSYTRADGGRAFLTTQNLVSASVKETLYEEDGA